MKYLFILFFIPLIVNSQSRVLPILSSIGSTTTQTSETQDSDFLPSWDYVLNMTGTGDTLSVAEFNAATFSSGDTIGILADTYIEGKLVFNESGSSGNPIVIGTIGTGTNYAKVYGSIQISGWTQYSGNIYSASCDSDITQVFVDDNKMKLARYPNTGYYNIDATNGSTTITSSDINGANDYTGATVIIHSTAWSLSYETVSSSSSTTITFSSADWGVTQDWGFCMTNLLLFLDEAGEWFYDSGTNTVYLWVPNGDDPDNYTVRGSTKDFGIYGNSVSYVDIKNLDVRQQDGDGIHFYNSDYITIDSCNVYDQREKGIFIDGTGSSHATISNNYVEGSILPGIRTDGDYHLITNNTLYDIGNELYITNVKFDIYGVGAGLEMEHGTYDTVRYNYLNRIGTHGIVFSYSDSSAVEYNYVKNAGTSIDDAGGIYSYCGDFGNSCSSGTIVRYNIVDSVIGNLAVKPSSIKSEGNGIYTDEKNHDVIIEYNTSVNCGLSGIFQHQNQDVTVRYNTVFHAKRNLGAKGYGSGVTYTNNIVYARDKDMEDFEINQLACLYVMSVIPTFDYNTYVSHYNTNVFRYNVAPSYAYYNFSDWKSTVLGGGDTNSTIDVTAIGTRTDSCFYNATSAAVDFTLTGTWRDLDGNVESSPLTLQPYKSKILLKD